MIMRLFILLILGMFLLGCATAPPNAGSQSFRQVLGRPIAKAGYYLGKSGATLLAASGACIITVPIGCVVGIPLLFLGAPLYYGGSALAGDETDGYGEP